MQMAPREVQVQRRVLQLLSKRQTNPGLNRAADQLAGVSRAISESFRPSRPGRTSSRYSLTGALSLRQDSTIERIAATFGPALALPTCSQFFRPSAIGRIEFSARLFDSSTSA